LNGKIFADDMTIGIELMEQASKLLRIMRQAERSTVACCQGHKLAKVIHFTHKGDLGLVRKHAKVDICGDDLCSKLVSRQRLGTFASCLAQNRANARMSILHVVHRVGVVLLLGNLDIEVDRLIGGTREHQEARSIHANFIDKLGESDHLARTLGHTHSFAIAEQVDQLSQHNLKRTRITPCGKHCLAAADITVVIGAPQVDQVIEPTLHLVVVVGHIRHEVRVFAVFLEQNTVLVIAEISGTEPSGAILVVQVALLVHDLKRAGNGRRAVLVGLVEAALAKPSIERGTKTGEGFAGKIEHLLIGDFTERLHAFLVANALPLVAIAIDNALSDILHIAAAIALLGHLDIMTKQLHIANGN